MKIKDAVAKEQELNRGKFEFQMRERRGWGEE